VSVCYHQSMGGWAMAMVLLLNSGSPPALRGRGSRYENVRCGVAVVLPPGWTATEIKDPSSDTSCAIGLRPANWNQLRQRAACHASEYAVYLSVHDGSLEDVEAGTLMKEDGAWMIEGRAGARNEAKVFQHPLGRGVKGTSDVGCYDAEDGNGYDGAAETGVAYVETGGRVVGFVADVNLPFDAKSAFQRIVNSLRIPGGWTRASPAPQAEPR
jgi:hypothetical protein